jgi:hypothetical protein
LSQKFSTDPIIVEKLITHCRERQQKIAKIGRLPLEQILRTHREELAYGLAEQKAYHDYEAQQIASGKNPSDPDFYRDFFATHKNLASPVGNADIVFHYPYPMNDIVLYAIGLFSLFVLPLLMHRAWTNSQKLRNRFSHEDEHSSAR